MQLLIPFASALSEVGRQAAGTLALPNLEQLLGRLAAAPPDAGDEASLSTPHERALAHRLGLTGADGALPWAAWQAAQDGIDVGDLPWGLLTPAHWRVGSQGVVLVDPAALALDESESRALLERLHPLFEEHGWRVAWGAPLRWYVAHPSLDGLACASLDRVIGREVDAWLAPDPRQRAVRRLQAEAQMLLHRDPANEARESRGAPVVNSFWLSGCGAWQRPAEAPELQVDERLRAPALAEDWARWADAWRSLDAGPLAEALRRVRAEEPVGLCLCGERSAQWYQTRPRPWWQRLLARAKPGPAEKALEAL